MEIYKDGKDDWYVENGEKKEYHIVRNADKVWTCSCPDYYYRRSRNYGDTCKHIKFAMDWEIFRLESEIQELRNQTK